MEQDLEKFVEDLALFFEGNGFPRIAGRILGLLLVCDPPYRSAGELADELHVSKASVSTMTRMLLSGGLIERVGVPGKRATYFGTTTDGFERRFELVIRVFAAFRPLADRGLRILETRGPERTERLRALRAMYGFWEREMPSILNKWRAERVRLVAEDSYDSPRD